MINFQISRLRCCFLLFLRQQSPCPDCTGFFEVYWTEISDYNHKLFEARRSWWKPLSKVSEIGKLVWLNYGVRAWSGLNYGVRAWSVIIDWWGASDLIWKAHGTSHHLSYGAAGHPWRIEYEGALYHVFSRGNDQQDIFVTDDDW
jgi:hypothetical protein